MTLSVLVIAQNEPGSIRQCLESAAWADKIVVVDALSEDGTVEASRQVTDKVYLSVWRGFAAQRNLGLERATGKWC
ncbi:MAG: glycosyltransferase [Candidatus Methylomirabilis sp.]